MIKMTTLAKAAFLLALGGLLGNAQAVTDYGYTIDSVTIYNPYDTYEDGDLSTTSTVSRASYNISTGVYDLQADRKWILTTSLDVASRAIISPVEAGHFFKQGMFCAA